MSFWEKTGGSGDWFTPAYIFDALGCEFDMDVAHPVVQTHVPADHLIVRDSLSVDWRGFVWMNPPFGGRNGLKPWLDKFFAHGNGIALTPDRTSAPWWQDAYNAADGALFIAGKVRFERPDGSIGKSPSNGTTLFASGMQGVAALSRASKHGLGAFSVGMGMQRREAAA